jgi:hypothetical protein
MALGFSNTHLPLKPYATGGNRFKVVDITLDTDYPAGGWPIAATDVGLTRNIKGIWPGQVAGFLLAWDKANSKLLAYCTGAGNAQILAEAAAGENGLAGLICTALVIGD